MRGQIFVLLIVLFLSLILVSCSSSNQHLEIEKIKYPKQIKKNQWFVVDIPVEYLETNKFYTKVVAEYLVDNSYEMKDELQYSPDLIRYGFQTKFIFEDSDEFGNHTFKVKVYEEPNSNKKILLYENEFIVKVIE